MKKQHILILISCLTLMIIVGICCFINIPRIKYSYDQTNDSYYVEYVYGNAKEYIIADYINGKPVTRIGARAFYQHNRLEKVIFEDVNLIKEIGRLAFSGCSSLKYIDLSNVDFIDRNAFEECYSLTKVVLSCEHLLTSLFYDCILLEEVVLYNTVSIGSWCFANTKIKKITLPETTKDVYINAFDLMFELEEINILSKDLYENEYLKSLNICNFL